MRVITRLFIISYFLCSGDVFAEILNYKNINTLSGIICQEQGISKFKINKDMTSETDFTIKVSGQCGAKFEAEKLVDLGKELNLTFSNQSLEATGKLGINKINIMSNKEGFIKLTIFNPLLNQTKSYSLSQSEWSPNSMIFSTKKVVVKNKGRVIANEKGHKVFLSHANIYRAWNYNSYLCPHQISKKQCEVLVNKF